jgi:NodT family efflux transporter outer membrane factor (OMF) lipoprotein
MNKNKIKLYIYAGIACVGFGLSSCKTIDLPQKVENRNLPENFGNSSSNDTINSAKQTWEQFFTDEKLQALITTALENNQELNITLQEINVSRNEIRGKRGEYLPTASVKAGVGVDKVARYTNIGAMEATTDIKPGKEMPDPLFDFGVGAFANWETDIWGKLHNATKAQVERYLASIEGRNFMVTNIVGEISDSYYDLLALDKELEIVQENIKIQENALRVVKLLKQGARSNELAVKRFEAQVLNTKSMQYKIQQEIVETENRINFLVGRFPQHVDRTENNFDNLVPTNVYSGLPSDLLANRPDIKAAEYELAATKLDIKSAKARFYPSLDLSAGIGLQAFNPMYLIRPKSILYNLAGDLVAPVLNRSAIKTAYYNANSKQIQAVYHYEQTILNAYIEVVNQMAKVKNLEGSYQLKSQEVDALTKSIDISNDLFKYARADYMEVLLTQRDALEAKFDLVEMKANQLKTTVAVYKALGGGWDQKDLERPDVKKIDFK